MSETEVQTQKKKPLFNDPKIGKIIEIPDSKTILINLGFKNSNIKKGDEVIIYEEGPDIKVDDSLIGRYDFEKDIVQVVGVHDNFSVCKKILTYLKPAPITSMATLMGGKEVQEEVELNVEETEIKNWEIRDSKIRINDPVKILKAD